MFISSLPSLTTTIETIYGFSQDRKTQTFILFDTHGTPFDFVALLFILNPAKPLSLRTQHYQQRNRYVAARLATFGVFSIPIRISLRSRNIELSLVDIGDVSTSYWTEHNSQYAGLYRRLTMTIDGPVHLDWCVSIPILSFHR